MSEFVSGQYLSGDSSLTVAVRVGLDNGDLYVLDESGAELSRFRTFCLAWPAFPAGFASPTGLHSRRLIMMESTIGSFPQGVQGLESTCWREGKDSSSLWLSSRFFSFGPPSPLDSLFLPSMPPRVYRKTFWTMPLNRLWSFLTRLPRNRLLFHRHVERR